MHRAKIAQPRVRMEGWRQRRLGSKVRNPQEEKRKKEKNTLDSYRPSHGRHLSQIVINSGFRMRPDQRIVTKLPLTELCDETGALHSERSGMVSIR